MTGLRFTDLQSRPLEFLDFTSLTLDEFQQLVPPFETAFHARMAAWRSARFSRNCRIVTNASRHGGKPGCPHAGNKAVKSSS